MRTRNVFKLSGKRIEYADFVKEAVLNPRINGLKLVLNGGFDWVDCKYGFVKLLLSRGQVAEITTHQDLLAKSDYLDAMYLGAIRGARLNVVFETKDAPACASDKRMTTARERYSEFVCKVRNNTFNEEAKGGAQ
jgi:hypothetical protein